jgi:hypothetical protein
MSNTLLKLPELKNYLESLKPSDWKPILDLIPEIENTKDFGHLYDDDDEDSEVLTFPFYIEAPVVREFEKHCYELGIVIDFDWSKWDEGRELLSGDKSVIETLDLITLCKLITAIIRNDRFCDGALIGAFEDGLILRILMKMKDLVQQTRVN